MSRHDTQRKLMKNPRRRTLLAIGLAALFLCSIVAAAQLIGQERLTTQFELRNRPPSLEHLFGTDWLGRDMFARTIKGLSLSIGVGLSAAAASVSISLVLGVAAGAMGKAADRIVSWCIDLFLSVPHLVSLVLISFAAGGGVKGIIIGIGITHWPSLARVIRAEVLQLRTSEYVQISKMLGKSRWWIAAKHLLPHLIPQVSVGFFLLFPHAVLHEAALTFLGLGLSPHQPAIGVILSESMRYLTSGMWWLALFPGISLLIIVRLFAMIGDRLRLIMDPHHSHR